SFVDPKVEGPFPTPDTQAVFAYIQERIKEREPTIGYYKRRYNALTITCQLPPNILSAIFVQVKEAKYSRYPITIDRLKYMSISHVCFHWRQVLLSTLGLSSNVQVKNSFVDPKAEGPFPTPETRSSAFAYIQERIREHEATANYYKRHSNALTITCQLPPEILSAIFLEVQHHEDPYPGRIDWIERISHVCSHWRQVALSTASLWSNIPVMRTPWATEMISRSGDRPLKIHYAGSLYSDKSLWPSKCYAVLDELLRCHLSRIKSFTLASDWRYYRSYPYENDTSQKRFITLLAFLTHAPVLEELRVHTLWGNCVEIIQYTVNLPQLRHLELAGCAVTWTDSSFVNLRSLKIFHLPEKTSPTIPQLLHLLQRTPLLEDFSISSIKRSWENRLTGFQRESVSLPYLTDLTIGANVSDCIGLLDPLHCSVESCELTLYPANASAGRKDDIKELAQIIESKCQGPVQKIVFCWDVTRFISGDSRSLSCTLDVKFISEGRKDRAVFWQSLNLDQLLVLEVWEGYGLVEQWSIFGSLPNLEIITVVVNEELLFEALVGETINTPSPPFPALKRLTVAREGEGPWKDTVEQMVSCLKLRHSMGLALECLYLKHYFEHDGDDASVAAIRRLREYVKDVITV
ncbi:hypothetical protein C0993_000878, partial [Termitomyces sp. T159_Od127]